jgi:hypothetical protein
VVRDRPLRQQVATLPAHTTILYGETEIALLSCLLRGGDRLGALAFPMLRESPSLDRLLHERQPAVIVVPAPRTLNSLSALRVKTLATRRHGFFFPAVSEMTIRPSAAAPLADLHLYVRTGETAVPLALSAAVSEGQPTPPGVTREVPARFEGWVRVWEPQLQGAPAVRVSLPDAWGWIEGIAADAPRPRVRWPWTAALSVSYQRRGTGRERTIRFGVRDLLAESGAVDLLPWIHAAAPVLGDDSGLVFLRTRFAAAGG